MGIIKSLKRSPAWLGVILFFLLFSLPLGVAQFWPVLVKDKTIPEWLVEKHGPSILTLALVWTLASAVVSVATYLIMASIASRNDRKLANASERKKKQTLLQTSGAEFAEVEGEWKKLNSSQKELLRRIYAAGELSWQQIDGEYKKGLLPTYVNEPLLLDYLLERSTLLECDNPTPIWNLKYSKTPSLVLAPKWKIKPSLREAVRKVISSEERLE